MLHAHARLPLVGLFALLLAAGACGQVGEPPPDGGCVRNVNSTPCSPGESVGCSDCTPDGGTIFGVQSCADNGKYGPCEP